MVLVLRALARLATFLVLLALALAGLAVALFSIGDSGDFSLPGLADLVGLPQLEDETGRLLDAVEANGSVAIISALAGLATIVVGGLLLIGALTPRRERLVVLERDEEGTLAARRRPLSRIAGALAEQARGVTASKVKLRPSRRARGGRLAIEAAHARTADPAEVERRTRESLDPLSQAFELSTRVRPKLGASGQRVQ